MATNPTAANPSEPPVDPNTPNKPTIDEMPLYTGPERNSIWQSPFIQDVLPLLTSLAIHIGLILLIWLTYETYTRIVEYSKEQIIIPDAQIVDGATPGGLTNPGLGEDPNQAMAQDQYDAPANADGWSDKPSQSLNQNLMGGSGDNANTESLIGRGSGGSMGRGKGIGTGDGDGGGSLAPFGMPGGGQGAGPRTQFLGTGGNATKIVYLCDASGTMLSVFDSLRVQLNKSIDILKPIQFFNVIFFSDDRVITFSKSGLIAANPENKKKAWDFIGSTAPTGGTDPIPAIQLAFQNKPQLIYVLTDGFDQVASFEAVAAEFRKHNADKSVKVNTILIGSTEQAELVDILKTIAKENGGTMKIIARDSFN